MRANLVNQQGQLKQVKVGFSWTVFFWGFWPTLFRGDWKYLIITLIVDFLGIFTMGTVSFAFDIIFAFFYNKLYVQELMDKGYVPSSASDKRILFSKQYCGPNIHVANN